MSKIYSILIAVFMHYTTLGQNVDFKANNFPGHELEFKVARKEYRIGESFYIEGKYSEALGHFLKANDFNHQHAKLNYKIAVCYMNAEEKTSAIPFFENYRKLDSSYNKSINYSLGYAYHLNYEWDKAIAEYTSFLGSLDDKMQDKAEKIKNTTKKIEECNNGKELVKTPLNVRIDNLGKMVNTQYKDYGPTISADESVLLFTSRREGTTGGGIYDPDMNEYFEDIYISYNKDGEWSKAMNIGVPVNTERHDAIVGLSFDGQKLFTYRDDEKGNGDVFESILAGEKWSDPIKLPEPINSPSHESSACLSYDGKMLYFVSDRPASKSPEIKSFGGRDIYTSVWDQRKKMWKPPKNIGKTINTQYNEETVYIHPDGKTLYFCSQGHKTMGGYDIFKSTFENGKWSEPKNIGYPINTPDDDVFFAVSASGKHAYYASVKPDGSGKRDIYCITFIDPPSEPSRPQLTLLKGTITDMVTSEPVNAKIEITDNEKNEVTAEFESNSTTGKYLISLPAGKNYGIAISAKDYLFHSENVNIPTSYGYQEITKDIALNKLVVGKKIVLNNIFFDHDKDSLRSESTAELDRLFNIIKEAPTMVIEISGHTDNNGSDTYNQKLSENRARSVVEFLVAKGVVKTRMEYKGYGETMPIATNDTEEGKQLNRRTEFKILNK